MDFTKKLLAANQKNQSLVCVGLDTDLSMIPESIKSTNDPIFEFNKQIIDATIDLVCAYKPNSAFYEANGVKGLEALQKTIEYIPDHIPVILDAKRGDIGNTCKQYAIACFDDLKADAVTISPYMGFDSISPFAEYEEKGLFILLKTSNPTAAELQDLKTETGRNVYLEVAELLNKWQRDSLATICAVVGATYPEDLKAIREVIPDVPILIPGLGAQGGDAQKTIMYGSGADKSSPMIINSSRGILYASSASDFAEESRKKTDELRRQLNSYLKA